MPPRSSAPRRGRHPSATRPPRPSSCSRVMPPSRSTTGTSPRTSTTVDSTPTRHGPPSTTTSTTSPRSASTCAAVVGEGRPDRFADGAATGTPAARSSASATGWSGTRTATLGSPAVAARGSASAAVQHQRQRPGPERVRQPQRQGGRARGHPPGGLRVRRVDDHGVVGRPALRREDARHRRRVQRVRAQPVDRLRRERHQPAVAQHRRSRRQGCRVHRPRVDHDHLRHHAHLTRGPARPSRGLPSPDDSHRHHPRRRHPARPRLDPRPHAVAAPAAGPRHRGALAAGTSGPAASWPRAASWSPRSTCGGMAGRAAGAATSSAGPTSPTTSAGCWPRVRADADGGPVALHGPLDGWPAVASTRCWAVPPRPTCWCSPRPAWATACRGGSTWPRRCSPASRPTMVVGNAWDGSALSRDPAVGGGGRRRPADACGHHDPPGRPWRSRRRTG